MQSGTLEEKRHRGEGKKGTVIRSRFSRVLLLHFVAFFIITLQRYFSLITKTLIPHIHITTSAHNDTLICTFVLYENYWTVAFFIRPSRGSLFPCSRLTTCKIS